MDRKAPVKNILPLLLLALTVSAMFAGKSAPEMQRGPTHSPHGALKTPCGSCHTMTSWSPIRAIPEFDHRTETQMCIRDSHLEDISSIKIARGRLLLPPPVCRGFDQP